jgi:putative (di)nucleoside polyphosphate hydrolase
MFLRLNVAAILRNVEGRILVCERLKNPGSWQFPQGGVNRMETLEEGLLRELEEEIGIPPHQVRILNSKGPYTYRFAHPKKGYDGKEQYYFLCQHLGSDSAVNVHTRHPEFRDFRWIDPRMFQVQWLPPMRVTVYTAVFRDFFGIELGPASPNSPDAQKEWSETD